MTKVIGSRDRRAVMRILWASAALLVLSGVFVGRYVSDTATWQALLAFVVLILLWLLAMRLFVRHIVKRNSTRRRELPVVETFRDK